MITKRNTIAVYNHGYHWTTPQLLDCYCNSACPVLQRSASRKRGSKSGHGKLHFL